MHLIKYKSISCLHTIEHFGLGRYGDKINPNGHIIGFQNIYKLLDNDASLYLSFPVSNISRIEFNAHRVFNINDIFEWIKQLSIKDLKLISFDLIDDNSELFENQNINLISKNINFGCGIYHFKKIDIHEKNDFTKIVSNLRKNIKSPYFYANFFLDYNHNNKIYVDYFKNISFFSYLKLFLLIFKNIFLLIGVIIVKSKKIIIS